MKFLDLVKVYIKSGNGGSGALSFRREKYIEKGWPDGGNGGRNINKQGLYADSRFTVTSTTTGIYYFWTNQ